MARLFGDSFEHYGVSANAFLLDAVYAQADAGGIVSFASMGGSRAYLMDGDSGLNNLDGLRKVLPASTDKVGCMGRFYFPSLPPSLYGMHIYSLLTADPGFSQVSFIVDANGCIRVVRGRKTFLNGDDSPSYGGTGTLIAQTDPIITAAAGHHIECQAYIHDTLGWVRIAVDGIHRYQETGLDTKHDSTEVVSVAQHRTYLSAGGSFYFKDYVLYDFTGTPSTDTDWCPTYDGSGVATGYIGDLQGIWRAPDGNTAEDDWGKSTGSSAFALVDETTPDDADYLYSTAVDDLTEMDLQDLPDEITYIRGIDYWSRSSKSDAGEAMITMGAKSGVEVTDSTDVVLTTVPSYNYAQINLDPETDARWTREGFNDSLYRIIRSV